MEAVADLLASQEPHVTSIQLPARSVEWLPTDAGGQRRAGCRAPGFEAEKGAAVPVARQLPPGLALLWALSHSPEPWEAVCAPGTRGA
ncbi:unnamed protein product [Rangifer tarandus platyrhynchus]|uniref:Uncharacterized protein n=1 Tax=Rangifer tarandus platyrhynchus TaxID=3082113 RepID=A0AC59YAC6_RANTA